MLILHTDNSFNGLRLEVLHVYFVDTLADWVRDSKLTLGLIEKSISKAYYDRQPVKVYSR